MNAIALFLSGMAFASGSSPVSASVEPPVELTAWRTAQGVFLSWSGSPQGSYEIWKGTASGAVLRMATLPGNQRGFLDLSAVRGQEYFYALGTGGKAGPVLCVPGRAGQVRILPALVTTCSALRPGGNFPANLQNYFQRSRDKDVQFFGYFLMKPFDPTPREMKLVWRDPKGQVFSEYSHSITPRRLELPDGPAGQILAPQAIGLREVVAQNGQLRVPEEPGLYTIELLVDDVPVSLSVFYLLKEEPARGDAPASPAGVPAAPARVDAPAAR